MKKSQTKLKTKIKAALHKHNGFRYQHPDWDPKLWNKSARDIKEYLYDRFRTTLDTEEYYGTMTLLYHTIPDKELLIEFKDSPQYRKMYNLPTENLPTERTEQNSTETIETIKTIKTIGE